MGEAVRRDILSGLGLVWRFSGDGCLGPERFCVGLGVFWASAETEAEEVVRLRMLVRCLRG